MHDTFGQFLRLRVFGASHGPYVGMSLSGFPAGFRVDFAGLQAFMERRAPGRDALSTKRFERDVPEFLAGLSDRVTTGGTIEARIANIDARMEDYDAECVVPRPGHADYTQWVQRGRIPSGGGVHSGRMTAPLCVAGGLCLQWLASRGVRIRGQLHSAGGDAEHPEDAIRQARQDGDSVGGVIEIRIDGVRPGLGGALFAGLESRLSSAVFAIPGVKGVEFGGGFALADMRGSQANDEFCMENGDVVIRENRHGGLLGGITTGKPVIFRVAMKPTPSIHREQRSVDLARKCEVMLSVGGRHDPCIAYRAVPVVEAMSAFVLADIMMEEEAKRPRICMTLTANTVDLALRQLKSAFPFVEMCELRVDWLNPDEISRAASFPAMAGMPVILTIRRKCDGGNWEDSEAKRADIIIRLLKDAPSSFAYVDLEDDFRHRDLEEIAVMRGVKIIRSVHDFSGSVDDIVQRAKQLRGQSDDIPKIAFTTDSCDDLARLFRQAEAFADFPHIFCGMGELGKISRILAVKTHSMLTYCSRKDAAGTGGLGHLSPENLVKDYGFRQLTVDTEIFAVTGAPIEHSISPEINNSAFFNAGIDAVMVPLAASSAEEALRCASALKIRGLAVTVPYKQEMPALMNELSDEALAVGAVNTVVRTDKGWYGANTDIAGFQIALSNFLQRRDLRGCKVAILGAGGAANAVAYVVAKQGGAACIFNRTLEKAERLAAKYGFDFAPLAVEGREKLSEYGQIIIQATSVGLSSNHSAEVSDPIPFYEFSGTERLFDLIYSPAETVLMKRAKAAGCQVENGMAMLFAQAREQRKLYQKFGYCGQ